MSLNRRQFVILAGASVPACRHLARAAENAATRPVSAGGTDAAAVDAGPVSGFTADGVNDTFRERGFFVIRRDLKLFAVSSVCTHKGCKVRVQDDKSYLCKCHGSRFDKDGKVTKGPATRDLPRLAIATDHGGHVLVEPNRSAPPTP